MKHIVYRVQGELTAEQSAELETRLKELEGVTDVAVSPSDADHTATLSVDLAAPLSAEALDALEKQIHVLLQTVGCSLIRTALANRYVVAEETPRKQRQVGLGAALATVITAVVLAVLLTFSLTVTYMRGNTPEVVAPGQGTQAEGRFDQLNALDRLFRLMSPLELDDQTLLDNVLKAYVASTGDKYAQYFTAEEYAEYQAANSGDMEGIGISIVEDAISIGGTEYQVIMVANVYPDSPAEEAGIQPGDAIVYVGTGSDRQMVHTIGYERATALLKGEAGTLAEFELYRQPDDADAGVEYDVITVSVERKKLQTRSVLYTVCETDATVGIIRITGFETNTASQFAAAVEALKTEGCTRFVLDLRYNPGGALSSVVDILTYFVRTGDKVISVKDKNGTESSIVISDATNKDGFLKTGSGELKPEDIGRFRDLDFAVLVNEYSASAAELFTANVRDYSLGTIVGVTTFGKGSIQTFLSMRAYGYDGVLKVTYGYYYPPNGEGYHGIGIQPHHEVALSEEALSYNFNRLPHAKDNQLQKAIEVLNAAD